MMLDGKCYINRDEYVNWAQGILLDRDASGNVILCNEVECHEADKILEEGGKIYLTYGGKTVSYIELNSEESCYEESLMSSGKEISGKNERHSKVSRVGARKKSSAGRVSVPLSRKNKGKVERTEG